MTIMNWFRTKADLIAENDRLHDQVLEQRERANRAISRANINGQLFGEMLIERDAALRELTVLRTREADRAARLRAAARKGAAVTNAKRAALKAVA